MLESRRDFSKVSLTAAATMAGTSPAPVFPDPSFNATADQMPIRASVMAYSFHGLLTEGKMDVFGFLETCKYRYHLQAADLWNGFLVSTEEGYLKKVKDELDERELVVPNLAVDGAHIWVDDSRQRDKNYANALAHLNAGRILGARFVRIDAGGGAQDREWSSEAFEHIVERYKEYAQYAYDHGFKAGAEVHWGPERFWPSMQKLHKAVDHPGFGICCHIGGWGEHRKRLLRPIARWCRGSFIHISTGVSRKARWWKK